ncbi:hypothetical protein NPIL_704751 [Nephila pilipes]|uniref:Uncharacterized protein n=1 Tax=Nephila pilipes TaxID=299642 RepID=A0A8X6Q5L1_NEPPI|nr:hypothetical protein NPIL_704751 [Nephila pilipes]
MKCTISVVDMNFGVLQSSLGRISGMQGLCLNPNARDISMTLKKCWVNVTIVGFQNSIHEIGLQHYPRQYRNYIQKPIPNTTYAQALNPKPDQQRAALDGKSTEATSTPRGENIPKNNNQNQQPESTDDFSIFDAIKELKNFFQLFPGLMGACKQMSDTPDKTDKLNIFFQAICTQI